MNLFCSSQEFDELCLEIAGKAGILRLQAKGGSMDPFIRSGDWVEVALCKDTAAITKGDIILFKKDESLYMHRVVKIRNGCFIAKGDRSLGDDGSMSAEDLVGKAVAVERNGRKIDLYSRRNRMISVLVADSGFVLQYLFLFLRKVSGAIRAAVSRVQGLRIYRVVAKKILGTDVVIREAKPEDEEGMMDLFLMGGQDIREGMASIEKDGSWLLAERKGKIAGGLTVARYGKDPRLWVIFGLEVKPLLRGLGIAEKMVRDAMARAKEGGAQKVGLFVNSKARPALGLYRKLGFIATDDFPAEFNRSDDELYLLRDLEKRSR